MFLLKTLAEAFPGPENAAALAAYAVRQPDGPHVGLAREALWRIHSGRAKDWNDLMAHGFRYDADEPLAVACERHASDPVAFHAVYGSSGIELCSGVVETNSRSNTSRNAWDDFISASKTLEMFERKSRLTNKERSVLINTRLSELGVVKTSNDIIRTIRQQSEADALAGKVRDDLVGPSYEGSSWKTPFSTKILTRIRKLEAENSKSASTVLLSEDLIEAKSWWRVWLADAAVIIDATAAEQAKRVRRSAVLRRFESLQNVCFSECVGWGIDVCRSNLCQGSRCQNLDDVEAAEEVCRKLARREYSGCINNCARSGEP
jgi:hypothetical protein